MSNEDFTKSDAANFETAPDGFSILAFTPDDDKATKGVNIELKLGSDTVGSCRVKKLGHKGYYRERCGKLRTSLGRHATSENPEQQSLIDEWVDAYVLTRDYVSDLELKPYIAKSYSDMGDREIPVDISVRTPTGIQSVRYPGKQIAEILEKPDTTQAKMVLRYILPLLYKQLLEAGVSENNFGMELEQIDAKNS